MNKDLITSRISSNFLEKHDNIALLTMRLMGQKRFDLIYLYRLRFQYTGAVTVVLLFMCIAKHSSRGRHCSSIVYFTVQRLNI